MAKRTPEPTAWARGEVEEIARRLARSQAGDRLVDEAVRRAAEFQAELANRVATEWAGHPDAAHLLELSRKIDGWLRDLHDATRASAIARQMKAEISPEP